MMEGARYPILIKLNLLFTSYFPTPSSQELKSFTIDFVYWFLFIVFAYNF